MTVRRAALVGFAVIAVLAIVVLLDREPSSIEPREAPNVLDSTPTGPVPEEQPRAKPKPVRDAGLPEAPLETEDPQPRCIVVGTVADEFGIPLAETRVRLFAYRIWADGIDVERLEGRYDHRGFEVSTDAAGAFRIEAPVPTAPRTMLKILPDRFHDSHSSVFGEDRRGQQPRLSAGVRDLGEIRLATTGALRGRVTDEHGQPLEGVEVSIGPGRSTTYSRDTTTAPDGSYVVAHAPIGTYAIKARLEGYLSGYIEPVNVEAQRDTDVADFVLAAAPTIEGDVRDEFGVPIAGVKLQGWPSSNGRSARAESDDEGRFVVYLPQNEAYTLEATREGFETWGSAHDKSSVYAPGTRDLEVVMHSIPTMQFHVVDAETGDSIERFGFRILADNGSHAAFPVHTERRRPPLEERPGGVTEATARSGTDLYVIAADGYPLATGDVEPDEAGVFFQTVRLDRGATLRGRVLRDREVVSGVHVEAVEGWMRGHVGESGEDDRTFLARANTMRSTRTDDEGRFEITGLNAATHRVTLRPDEGAPSIVVPIELARKEDRDLGDLVLRPGAAIAGSLLLPPGVEPAGFKVYLDDWRDDNTAITDAWGQFRFEDLAAGRHTLTLAERPGELAGSDAVAVDLEEGKTTEVTLDVRDRLMCSVKLTIDLGTLSAEGAQVYLFSEDGANHSTLGVCDASGTVVGSVRAWGDARVGGRLAGRRTVIHPEVLLELEPRKSIERDVHFEFASLSMGLPAGVSFPREGSAELRLDSGGAWPPVPAVRIRFADGKPVGEEATLARVELNRLVVDALPPGTYTLTCVLHEGSRFENEPYVTVSKQVTLAAGRTLETFMD